MMNSELRSLSDWLNTNKLTLNIGKTHYMVFHRARLKTNENSIFLFQNETINQVQIKKILGIIMETYMVRSYYLYTD